MEVQWKKNVRVICDLEPGDKVTVKNWGRGLDGKVMEVEEVVFKGTGCETGFMIKLKGYERTLDSNWLDKIK